MNKMNVSIIIIIIIIWIAHTAYIANATRTKF